MSALSASCTEIDRRVQDQPVEWLVMAITRSNKTGPDREVYYAASSSIRESAQEFIPRFEGLVSKKDNFTHTLQAPKPACDSETCRSMASDSAQNTPSASISRNSAFIPVPNAVEQAWRMVELGEARSTWLDKVLTHALKGPLSNFMNQLMKQLLPRRNGFPYTSKTLGGSIAPPPHLWPPDTEWASTRKVSAHDRDFHETYIARTPKKSFKDLWQSTAADCTFATEHKRQARPAEIMNDEQLSDDSDEDETIVLSPDQEFTARQQRRDCVHSLGEVIDALSRGCDDLEKLRLCNWSELDRKWPKAAKWHRSQAEHPKVKVETPGTGSTSLCPHPSKSRKRRARDNTNELCQGEPRSSSDSTLFGGVMQQSSYEPLPGPFLPESSLSEHAMWQDDYDCMHQTSQMNGLSFDEEYPLQAMWHGSGREHRVFALPRRSNSTIGMERSKVTTSSDSTNSGQGYMPPVQDPLFARHYQNMQQLRQGEQLMHDEPLMMQDDMFASEI
ncbi:MAG: hypothetical protein M1828_001751 [Chrysothrix sp. TS-e1954]|nr:MAG: hypothetical protein M1828_001751 [Chrysothrix sp. TS-e1954]